MWRRATSMSPIYYETMIDCYVPKQRGCMAGGLPVRAICFSNSLARRPRGVPIGT